MSPSKPAQKLVKEGWVKKGGVNAGPTVDRPPPPKPQQQKQPAPQPEKSSS